MPSAPMLESRRNFHFRYSPFIITLQDRYERIFSVVKNESFVCVLNGEDVQSNVVDGVLISRKVHESLRSTPGNFQFALKDESITPIVFQHSFEFAHSHVFGDLTRDEQHLFVTISELLGNESLMYHLIEGPSQNVEKNLKNDSNSQRTGAKDTVTEGNVVQSLEFDFHEVEADHCASHFHCYSVDLPRRVNKDILHTILSSSSFEFESEDDFVRILIELGKDYLEFFEYIEVNCLTREEISVFLDQLTFDDLTQSIWMKLVDRLQQSMGQSLKSK
jgi:hypothetical protein